MDCCSVRCLSALNESAGDSGHYSRSVTKEAISCSVRCLSALNESAGDSGHFSRSLTKEAIATGKIPFDSRPAEWKSVLRFQQREKLGSGSSVLLERSEKT
jgi:hypothetical protein